VVSRRTGGRMKKVSGAAHKEMADLSRLKKGKVFPEVKRGRRRLGEQSQSSSKWSEKLERKAPPWRRGCIRLVRACRRFTGEYWGHLLGVRTTFEKKKGGAHHWIKEVPSGEGGYFSPYHEIWGGKLRRHGTAQHGRS